MSVLGQKLQLIHFSQTSLHAAAMLAGQQRDARQVTVRAEAGTPQFEVAALPGPFVLGSLPGLPVPFTHPGVVLPPPFIDGRPSELAAPRYIRQLHDDTCVPSEGDPHPVAPSCITLPRALHPTAGRIGPWMILVTLVMKRTRQTTIRSVKLNVTFMNPPQVDNDHLIISMRIWSQMPPSALLLLSVSHNRITGAHRQLGNGHGHIGCSAKHRSQAKSSS